MTKTIRVSKVLELANKMLAMDLKEDGTRALRREGISMLLESILHDTDNYNGYTHIGWDQDGGFNRWQAAGRPDDTTPFLGDQSRRVYY